MPRTSRWNIADLEKAIGSSTSIRQVIEKLGLVPAGGNYQQIKKAIKEHHLDTTTITGMGWRKNRTFPFTPRKQMEEILTKNSDFQSFKLKKRLFRDGLKLPKCELCGWAKMSLDGRIPVELDHINGDRYDNRIENLRILCPNCHSLQATHRGMNQKRRGGEIGRHATLKML
jgi:hypothetical protein